MDIRDPLHVFIRVDQAERAVVDSAPFQRLRYVHQLALTYLVYPGATHRRFEHSLGVMELATRIFDTVCDRRHLHHDEAREVVPDEDDTLRYWRRVVRLAALCHDLGHLPFSHAAEAELLPKGVDHEAISRAHILSPEMRKIWAAMEPPVTPEHIALLAVGPEEGEAVSAWQAILSEIITGDVFGADRMDYLLRDSLHTGVAYGRFDHHRLIDTLRILPEPRSGPGDDADRSRAASLGIQRGGVQSAEALLLARYFSFSQVYFHRTRRIYDIHLKDFLKAWLEPKGGFLPDEPEEHLKLTDNEVLAAIHQSARGADGMLQELALRIIDRRRRFSLVYEPTPDELAINADASAQVADWLEGTYGVEAVRRDQYGKPTTPFDFPVMERDHNVVSSTGVSEVLGNVPTSRFDFVFLDPVNAAEARSEIALRRQELVQPPTSEDNED